VIATGCALSESTTKREREIEKGGRERGSEPKRKLVEERTDGTLQVLSTVGKQALL
jgi:hypothetical protein